MCVLLLLEKHLKPEKAEILVNIPSLYNLREEWDLVVVIGTKAAWVFMRRTNI